MYARPVEVKPISLSIGALIWPPTTFAYCVPLIGTRTSNAVPFHQIAGAA